MTKTTYKSELSSSQSHVEHLPETYLRSLKQAVEILKAAGCTEVFVFGSGVTGQVRDNSDLDLAVRGCPKGKFFQVLGQLLLELDYPVDLISLDSQDSFARYLEEEGELVRVG